MFKSRLPMIAAELLPRLGGAASAGAELIAQAARERVPVDTGRLRDAIHVEADGPGEFAVIAGNNEVFYGHIVEHGGAHTAARPFMIPALEASRGEITKIAKEALRSLS
jgi:HK97 gp10 family phage protein